MLVQAMFADDLVDFRVERFGIHSELPSGLRTSSSPTVLT
jgi:hypothetical protein